MRVLIGTLCCGEKEYGQCLAALREQTYANWSHFVLRDLPEQQAHDELYGRFMADAADHDLFLKLDADMVLSDPSRLDLAVACFVEDDQLDHAVFRVHDWMTDTPIIGVHAYRSRVSWPARDDDLFTDLPPVFPGRRRYFLRPPHSPLALHSPDPAPLQAFHFGLHRGLKALQPTGTRRPLQAVSHWRLLRRVWRRFDRDRDVRRGLALLAFECVLAGSISPRDADYSGARLAELFEPFRQLDADEIHARLSPRWSSAWRRETTWLRSLKRSA